MWLIPNQEIRNSDFTTRNQKFWSQNSKTKNDSKIRRFFIPNSKPKIRNCDSSSFLAQEVFTSLNFGVFNSTFETCEHILHKKIRNSDFKTQNLKTQNQKFWFQNQKFWFLQVFSPKKCSQVSVLMFSDLSTHIARKKSEHMILELEVWILES